MENVASMAWGVYGEGTADAAAHATSPRVLQPLDRHLLGQRLKLYIGVDCLVETAPDDRTLRDQALRNAESRPPGRRSDTSQQTKVQHPS